MSLPKTGADEWAASQASPDVTVNEALRLVEAGAGLFRVEDDDLTAPPGSCADGAQYIAAATASGAWAGQEGCIAIALGANAASGWRFIAPEEGMRAYLKDENAEKYYDGAAWAAVTAPGVGTAAALDVDTDGGLTANSDALIATQKATRTYVDAKLAGLSWKQAVRAATTANGALATAYENGDTVDGVVLATGDRLLIKDQSSASENGIYVVNASGAPSRAGDADSGAELVNASVYVSEGTANADTQWTCSTNAPITIGSTALAFAQLTSSGAPTGPITSSGLTMATARLLGRTTASTGAVEEITIGAGLSLSAGALSATVGGGSGKPAITFTPYCNEPPTSNYATLDLRNNHPCLDFDATTQETAVFSAVMPQGYAGGNLVVEATWAATSATSGTIGWDVAFERVGSGSQDIDSDGFATAATITAATAPGTSGVSSMTSVTVTAGSDTDSIAAGDLFRVRIRRDVANDTATGDAELLSLVVREA